MQVMSMAQAFDLLHDGDWKTLRERIKDAFDENRKAFDNNRKAEADQQLQVTMGGGDREALQKAIAAAEKVDADVVVAKAKLAKLMEAEKAATELQAADTEPSSTQGGPKKSKNTKVKMLVSKLRRVGGKRPDGTKEQDVATPTLAPAAEDTPQVLLGSVMSDRV